MEEIACIFNDFLQVFFSDVNKTFMTRPRSGPNGQDQDQDFEMLFKQDQDLLSKTKTSEPKSRPRPNLTEYDSELRLKSILQDMN